MSILIKRKPLNFLEKLYLPEIARGLSTTFKKSVQRSHSSISMMNFCISFRWCRFFFERIVMSKVFKICEKDEWENVQHSHFFEGSKIDKHDGFIHFSTSEQLKGTLEKYFKSKSQLYLLDVNTKDLDIIWEVSRNKQMFPHLYKPLPVSAVAKVYKDLKKEGQPEPLSYFVFESKSFVPHPTQ